MNLIQFVGAIELGLIFSLVGIAVYISFRVLDFPDLTADGSFPLGAAIAVTLILNDFNPFLATFIAVLGGCCAGLLTAWLNVRWNILNLLASILTMTALYSINLRIMGRPNQSILDEETLFTPFETLLSSPMYSNLIAVLGVTVIVAVLVWLFLSTEIGLAIRATGNNAQMAQAQGVSTKKMTLLGMALSNGLIALAGAIFAQVEGYADVSMGVGTIIVGLAAVIIGEVVLSPKKVIIAIIGCVIGSLFYRLAIAGALNAGFMGLQASDLNLITAAIVGFAMILPKVKSSLLKSIKK